MICESVPKDEQFILVSPQSSKHDQPQAQCVLIFGNGRKNSVSQRGLLAV
jgi:hypothetical protein